VGEGGGPKTGDFKVPRSQSREFLGTSVAKSSIFHYFGRKIGYHSRKIGYLGRKMSFVIDLGRKIFGNRGAGAGRVNFGYGLKLQVTFRKVL